MFALSLLGCATIHGPDGPITGPAGQRHRQRSHSIAFLRVDPQLRALRNEPGFQRIVQTAAFR